MNERIEVYKVVRVDKKPENLVSAFARGAALVEYIPGADTVAPAWLAREGYLLTAFSSLHNALQFVENIMCGEKFEIWQASATAVRNSLPPSMDWEALSAGQLKGLASGLQGWPNGTVFCRSIRLQAKVRERKRDI